MVPLIEDVTTIESVMDKIDQPMFLLDVEGEREFVFRRLNRCHLTVTGLNDNVMNGKAPHEVLPQRLADTVVSNYEKCRASGESYSYEENLELPTGARWWQTCLSPVKDANGTVVKIIGLAIDITKRKDGFFDASQKLSEMTKLNEDLQVFAASTAQDMQGPFQTMVALLDMVMDGFVDLGDEKMDQLMLCSEIATDAISNMSGILQAAQGLQVEGGRVEKTDFHHVASDIAALLDPHQRLSIDFPKLVIETDRVALQMVLRNIMENAVRYADARVGVTVTTGASGFVDVTVSDDGVGQSLERRSDGSPVVPDPSVSACDFGLASARAMVHSRGGTFVQAQCPFPTGASIRFSLPGKCRPAKAGIDLKPSIKTTVRMPDLGYAAYQTGVVAKQL